LQDTAAAGRVKGRHYRTGPGNTNSCIYKDIEDTAGSERAIAAVFERQPWPYVRGRCGRTVYESLLLRYICENLHTKIIIQKATQICGLLSVEFITVPVHTAGMFRIVVVNRNNEERFLGIYIVVNSLFTANLKE
jgi:hypothetical protein